MSADLLTFLARANLAGGCAILLVLMLRAPLRRAAGARAAYGLWLLVPLVALASLAPFPQGAALAPLVFDAPQLPTVSAVAAPVSSAPGLAVLAWALGALACAVVLGVQQARFVAGLGPLHPVLLGGRRVMRSARADAGPAVVGASIVVPLDFETRFSPGEQEAILAHEARHIVGGDVVANALAALALCLCWFNPLVHFAVRKARVDQELACDAAVIEARPGLRRCYGEALLKTQIAPLALPIGCTWPSRAAHPLRQRIVMLKSPPPSRRRRALSAAVLTALAVGGGYTAWAAQPGRGHAVVQPDWVDRPSGADMARFYPAEAVKQRLPGEVVVQCRVRIEGTLEACAVIRQAPEGAGFGEAVLQMSSLFRMKPLARDGRPVAGGVVRIPVAFRLAPEG